MDKGYARPTARARALRNNATDAERVLWQAISARKVSGIRFNRQVPVGPFICDFVARSIGLVIEVDGGQHEDAVDAERTRYIEPQGFRVIRFWNNDVLGNLDGVIEDIMRVVADMPSPTPPASGRGVKCP
ncbi:hypothetical protein CJD35_14875 [Sphingobium xenophagum]|uniref:DUF559 domain-containing protein n=1 Tax=Sphingobium xenophagum TaxID=121428 RepID=A0A249MW68_SPHXE|nr:endonuclease domain-containing protein [Sphingobium xenophagum]ASY45568.1 hypothetical protein CJD35_14875 [Sphingobium xenophagum]